MYSHAKIIRIFGYMQSKKMGNKLEIPNYL